MIDELKRLEHEGYHFEAADASLELLMRRAAGGVPDFFRVESMRVITDELPDGAFTTEATVKVWVGTDGPDGDDAERHVWVAEGNGPVNAIDTALRKAIGKALPARRRHPSHRLQGPHPRRGQRHRRDDAGAAVGHRRSSRLDDDRRQPEHHRGVVACARGQPGVRAPASSRLTLARGFGGGAQSFVILTASSRSVLSR